MGRQKVTRVCGEDSEGMSDMHQTIIDAVERAATGMVTQFEAQATRFFTENDLVCALHRLIHSELAGLGLDGVPDSDGLPHGLLHCEYPTSFRCDMSECGFLARTDDYPTPAGGRYKRGHYDLVVLNPVVVKQHSYAALKGQNYALLQSRVLPKLDATEPMILYGLELAFTRDEIGVSHEQTARNLVATVLQDTAKLNESLARPEWMRKGVMLAFVKGTSETMLASIRTALGDMPTVRLISAK
jgi:hypothetical protein